MVFAGFIVWLLNWQFIFTKHCNFLSFVRWYFSTCDALPLSLDSWFQCYNYSLKTLFRHMVSGPFHKVNV